MLVFLYIELKPSEHVGSVWVHKMPKLQFSVWKIYYLYRSGTEEDFTELSQLLEDISVYVWDFAFAQEEKKCETKKKEDDRRKREEMRRAAMMSMFQYLHFQCICLISYVVIAMQVGFLHQLLPW